MTTIDDNGRECGRSDRSAADAAGVGSAGDHPPQIVDISDDGDARWQGVEARIDALVAARPRLTVTRDSAVWLNVGQGVQKRQLYVDADAGWESFFLKLDPGAEMPPHPHSAVEECLVLSGEIEIDGDAVREGELHIAFAGHDHGTLVSNRGALLYIRGPLPPLDLCDLIDPVAR